MIDFDKPIRFVDNNKPAHFIGKRLDGLFVIEVDLEDRLFIVDKDGRAIINSLPPSLSPIIENVPERITRWIVVTPYTGFDSEEEAHRAAERFGCRRYTLARVEVEFDGGERP